MIYLLRNSLVLRAHPVGRRRTFCRVELKINCKLEQVVVVALKMADREERRFAEVSRDSVKLMAESAGVELSDDLAAVLAEDVCYRLREATQVRAAHDTLSNTWTWRLLGLCSLDYS